MHDAHDNAAPDVSYVVIGYNEGASLRACLRSVIDAPIGYASREVIYVDGGSTDGSIAIAKEAGADAVLGGEKRRRAAENRNLGLAAARGNFVQFVDGDMTIAPDWPLAALGFLKDHADAAAVCGNLDEACDGVLFKALQIDWGPREGPIRHCGGAAMYARDVLVAAGGFPEDAAYGEEPLLCWRIRNELGKRIYQLNRTMANHDLGFNGLGDYLRRNVRCGMTYADVAARCSRTPDKLWLKEAVVNGLWATGIVAAIVLVALGSLWVKAIVLATVCAVAARKLAQTLARGYPLGVACVYAVHTYLSKIPIACGEGLWLLQRICQRAKG